MGTPIDVASARWAMPGILFVLMGVTDALVQSYCLWLIGAHANEPDALSRYAGYYKGVQSAGAGVAWMLDALGVDFAPQLVICAVFSVVCAPLTMYLATTMVADRTAAVAADGDMGSGTGSTADAADDWVEDSLALGALGDLKKI